MTVTGFDSRGGDGNEQSVGLVNAAHDEHGVFDRDDSFHRGQRETPASVPSLLHDPPGHRLVEVERAGDSHVGLDVSESDAL